MARLLVLTGVDRVVATPHVSIRHQNSPEGIRESTLKLKDRISTEGIPLRIETGAEVSAALATGMDDGTLSGLCLGRGDWLLLEPPTKATSFDLHEAVFSIQERGFRVLLAHPERNPALQNDVELLDSLVRLGVRTQVTAQSLTGRFGRQAEKFAIELMARDLVHTIASDAHHPEGRPPGMVGELQSVGYGYLADWLCRDMPSWILDGGTEPRRPDSQGPRRQLRKGLLERMGLKRRRPDPV